MLKAGKLRLNKVYSDSSGFVINNVQVMKKTCRYLNYPLIMILILSMSINGCILPNQGEEQLPTVATDAVADISSTLAVCNGTLISTGGSIWVNRGICYSNIVAEPTLQGDFRWADVGSHTGTFSVLLDYLTPDTKYYVRAYAINEAGEGYGNVIEFTTTGSVTGDIVFNPDLTYDSMIDIDGNTYKTIKIGDQTWMAENLKTTKYNDGIDIPLVTAISNWVDLSTPGYCWYLNDGGKYKNIYGALYNWYTVNTGKLCPAGWHVPDDTEWEALVAFTGGESVAGNHLKEADLTHWVITEESVTNSSGFTALPGGTRWGTLTDPVIYFTDMGYTGHFWSTTEDYDPVSEYQGVYTRTFKGSSHESERSSFTKSQGISVRCVKD